MSVALPHKKPLLRAYHLNTDLFYRARLRLGLTLPRFCRHLRGRSSTAGNNDERSGLHAGVQLIFSETGESAASVIERLVTDAREGRKAASWLRRDRFAPRPALSRRGHAHCKRISEVHDFPGRQRVEDASRSGRTRMTLKIAFLQNSARNSGFWANRQPGQLSHARDALTCSTAPIRPARLGNQRLISARICGNGLITAKNRGFGLILSQSVPSNTDSFASSGGHFVTTFDPVVPSGASWTHFLAMSERFAGKVHRLSYLPFRLSRFTHMM